MEGGGESGNGSIILASSACTKMPTISSGCTFMYVDQLHNVHSMVLLCPPQGPQCALALRAVVPGEMLATEAYSGRRRRGAGNVDVQAMP